MSDLINYDTFNTQSEGDAPTVNKSLHKALLILDCFTEATPEWGVTDLSRQLGISKSSVSTMLGTLASLDLLYQSPTTRRYRVGLRCLELGYVASSRMLIRDFAFPFLETLLKDNRIVYMGIPYKYEVLYVETLLPVRRQVNYSSVGRRAAFYSTAIGKAILAHMPNSYIEHYLETIEFHARTQNTIATAKQLEEELVIVRQQGYALDRQESELGIQCVGVPIRRSDGNVVAGISISGSPAEINFDNVEQLTSELLSVGRNISNKNVSAGY